MVNFAYVTLTLSGLASQPVQLSLMLYVVVRTPKVLLPSVWPLPISLAATFGISCDFSSSPYLDVSVRGVPFVYLWIQYTMTAHYHCRVSPFGNLRINSYLRLPAAYRSLSRPSSAPDAKAFTLCSCSLELLKTYLACSRSLNCLSFINIF